jgi:hypothetical protein
VGEGKKRREAGLGPRPPVVDLNQARKALAFALLGGKPTTPSAPLSVAVTSFCRDLSGAAEPVFLPFTDTGDGYEGRYCHIAVKHRVKHHGGKRVTGWMIWENARFCEGEFHSVWQDDDGKLVDITPRLDGEIVLFLPDPSTKIVRSGIYDIAPTNRTNLRRCPFAAGGIPAPDPVFRQVYPTPESTAPFQRFEMEFTNADLQD